MPAVDFDVLFSEALVKISSYQEGTVFLAKEALDSIYWKSLERGDKLRYGSYFKRKVVLGYVPNVAYLNRADNNSAQYVKLRNMN